MLLTVVPMLAFLVGRVLVDDRLLRACALLIGGLSLAAAAYGLFQTFVGFPSWDQAWADRYGYAALNVVGVTRAFSTFTAASEYAAFLAAGVVVWIAFGFRILRLPVALAGVGVLITALWFEASRGIFVLTVLAVALLLVARSGMPLSRAVVLGLVILGAIPLAVGRLAPTPEGQAASTLSEHQAQGLSDPFADNSSLHSHIELVREGVAEAFRNPLGRGAGAVTTAAAKFGGNAKGAEADLGNAGLAAGILGLMAYVAVVLLAGPRLYQMAVARRDPNSLVAFGFILVTFFQWLNGGQYAVVFLPWLAMGWADREWSIDERDAGARVASQV
ncbi:MAG TPA: hypothetical protein VK988_21375 [Acidimicrobiales bacterium]|nr:hypothetical protein [Acidimicrobiales bacterium]